MNPPTGTKPAALVSLCYGELVKPLSTLAFVALGCDWGITCGTVAQNTVPIEIKPHSERHIQLYWQLSTDKWENPQHFVVFHSLEQRSLRGEYRFVLRYALQPWTLMQHSSATYSLTSPEFVVTVCRIAARHHSFAACGRGLAWSRTHLAILTINSSPIRC